MSKNTALTTCFPSRSVRRGNVEIDLQDNALRVRRRKYYLEPSQAKIVAVIMENSRYRRFLNEDSVSMVMGYNCSASFRRSLNGLMRRLAECEIANEGGVDSAYEEPTIYADSLIIRDNGIIRFNALLARVINSTNCVSESNLARMRGAEIKILSWEDARSKSRAADWGPSLFTI